MYTYIVSKRDRNSVCELPVVATFVMRTVCFRGISALMAGVIVCHPMR
jgi:hypothetical protein